MSSTRVSGRGDRDRPRGTGRTLPRPYSRGVQLRDQPRPRAGKSAPATDFRGAWHTCKRGAAAAFAHPARPYATGACRLGSPGRRAHATGDRRAGSDSVLSCALVLAVRAAARDVSSSCTTSISSDLRRRVRSIRAARRAVSLAVTRGCTRARRDRDSQGSAPESAAAVPTRAPQNSARAFSIFRVRAGRTLCRMTDFTCWAATLDDVADVHAAPGPSRAARGRWTTGRRPPGARWAPRRPSRGRHPPEPPARPVASFTFAPASPDVGEEITFDASSSSEGEIDTYEWLEAMSDERRRGRRRPLHVRDRGAQGRGPDRRGPGGQHQRGQNVEVARGAE